MRGNNRCRQGPRRRGCSGGGTPPMMEQTISGGFDYISQLIANSDPIDINGLTLASDDNSDPTLVN